MKRGGHVVKGRKLYSCLLILYYAVMCVGIRQESTPERQAPPTCDLHEQDFKVPLICVLGFHRRMRGNCKLRSTNADRPKFYNKAKEFTQVQ